jgi:site-specific DNA-methyltransferase (adenine-specific)
MYCAKASRAERNAGLDGMPERASGVMQDDAYTWTHDGKGNAITLNTRSANHHPTVKPLSLMKWLLTLVVPPGGTVLDPFLGSGTTACAAALLGISCIGIEADEEYLEIARRRVAHWEAQAQHLTDLGPLFAALETKP